MQPFYAPVPALYGTAWSEENISCFPLNYLSRFLAPYLTSHTMKSTRRTIITISINMKLLSLSSSSTLSLLFLLLGCIYISPETTVILSLLYRLQLSTACSTETLEWNEMLKSGLSMSYSFAKDGFVKRPYAGSKHVLNS
uniref:Uncharacterized protein n=1 Tax=Glossina pallidipes TaxID=7398 RepID=A0A1A9ZPR9_GLOPL